MKNFSSFYSLRSKFLCIVFIGLTFTSPRSSFLMAATPTPQHFFQDLENFQQKNLSLETLQEKVKASKSQLLSKSLFWTPDLAASVGRSQNAFNDVRMPYSDYAQLSAHLNLFKGGIDILNLKEARALMEAQKLMLQNQVLKVEKDAAHLIFRRLYLLESLRIQEELLRMKEESLKIVQGRYQQGKTPYEEVTKAKIDLNQQQNRWRMAILAISENDFHIQSSFVPSILTQTWPFHENQDFAFSRQQSPTLEKKMWPRVEQKWWQVLAQEYSWKAAQRQHLPKLDWSFQYQRSPLDDLKDRQWSTMLELKIPLWSKYETQAAVSMAYANLMEAQSDLKTEEKVVELTRDFLARKLEMSRQNLQETRKNLLAMKNLYQNFLRSFRYGRLSTNDLMLEQNRVLESESALAESLLNYHEAVVEACLLLGLRIQSCWSP